MCWIEIENEHAKYETAVRHFLLAITIAVSIVAVSSVFYVVSELAARFNH
jgi:hypothetical protein